MQIGATILQAGSSIQSASSAFQYVSSVGQQIYQLAVQLFNLIQNLILCAFGIKEWGFDFAPSKAQHERSKTISEVADEQIDHLSKIHGIVAEFNLVHGALYLGSGISGSLGIVGEFLNWGAAVPILQHIGAGLFIIVNFYALGQNMKLLDEAQKLSEEGTHPKLARKLKWSAVMGIINNVGYILSTILLFFPGTFYVGVALGVLAFLVGTVKIIYDYYYLNPDLAESIPNN